MLKNKRRVLILGGTGAMGISLIDILAGQGWDIYVTSRNEQINPPENVVYIKGNAKDTTFLGKILKEHYDVIIDFMSYKTDEFKTRMDLLLYSTGQYIFLSSSRVYAESNGLLNEDSPRLLDVCSDKEYLATDEYALAKARQENLLKGENGCYTIVRPSLTYNNNRLQLVISEKEEWLYRALHGKKIVLPQDIMDIQTSMAWGKDVATCIAGLVGNEKAYGEVVHIASPESRTWNEVLEIYQNVMAEKTGKCMDVIYGPKALEMGKKLNRYYQIKYARGISRRFDNHKISNIIGEISFTSPEDGLRCCLEEFLDHPQFGPFRTKQQAYFDRITGEKTNIKEIGPKKEAVKYYIFRYSPYFNFYHGEK